ncbi:MAG: nuclear transport factor 2 family protein [Bosea sp.]|uniref:nuclear transport factor 2 family protein n=1 Tax=Bosea sp. (in: a-proteobacteria) TaxID=1871050 RepID=UPI001AC4B69C|nr:nuclear transport factor 2 family protein [Bosea sp. (in: a-proteobacteria)]MBN9450926.1 nuclear transport factor 2 family protein [Bosea sp. (in: a-proteobacteria)]
MNADIKAVEATVRTYLDGLYEGDAEKLAHVFHPTSALTTVREENAVRNRPSPQAAGMQRDDHILTIDLVGPTLALVKVKCQMPPRYFTDLLSLLKIESRWQIVQKVFMTETLGA